MEITVAAKVDNLNEVMECIDGYLESIDCPIKAQTQIDISVDEIFANIASYAYDNGEGDVTIEISKNTNPDSVWITFIDSGNEYNPLEKEDPDVTLSVDERGIGGLGIFLVKKNMDDMKYERKNNQNIFTIIKNI